MYSASRSKRLLVIGAGLSVLASIMMALFAPAALRVFLELHPRGLGDYGLTMPTQAIIPIAERDLGLAAISAIIFAVGSGSVCAGLRHVSLDSCDSRPLVKPVLVVAVAHVVSGLAILIGCAIALDCFEVLMSLPTIPTHAQVRNVTNVATIAVTSGYLLLATTWVVLLIAVAANSVPVPSCSHFALWLMAASSSVFAILFVVMWLVDVRPLASGNWLGVIAYKPRDPLSAGYLIGILRKSQIAGICIVSIGIAYFLVIRGWLRFLNLSGRRPQADAGLVSQTEC